MKKILLILLTIFLCNGCADPRSDYYVLSIDDYTLTPGYDDAEYLRLAFDMDIKDTLEPGERLEGVDLDLWKYHVCTIDLVNPKKKSVPSDEAVLQKLDLFVGNLPAEKYAIDGIVLSSSVKENCQNLGGEYIERNGYACVIGKKVHGQDNIVILSGDILNIDQDELHRIQIYVE
ncbi:MAG: hypothetical protein II577_03550 [Erysipelotrichaceae bacterium]|nr:hypothetical protein [Erysipelotrichaceae bacterium]